MRRVGAGAGNAAAPRRRPRPRRPRPGSRTRAASPRGRPRSRRGGRGGPARRSAARRTPGANATRPRAGSSRPRRRPRRPGRAMPTSDDSGVPTLPATATGMPGGAVDRAEQLDRRGLAVRAGHGDELVRAAAARRARARRRTSMPRSRAAAITGASRGTPGLFTTVRTRSSSSTPSVPRCDLDARRRLGRGRRRTPITSPCSRSMRAAAAPERARPTTR